MHLGSWKQPLIVGRHVLGIAVGLLLAIQFSIAISIAIAIAVVETNHTRVVVPPNDIDVVAAKGAVLILDFVVGRDEIVPAKHTDGIAIRSAIVGPTVHIRVVVAKGSISSGVGRLTSSRDRGDIVGGDSKLENTRTTENVLHVSRANELHAVEDLGDCSVDVVLQNQKSIHLRAVGQKNVLLIVQGRPDKILVQKLVNDHVVSLTQRQNLRGFAHDPGHKGCIVALPSDMAECRLLGFDQYVSLTVTPLADDRKLFSHVLQLHHPTRRRARIGDALSATRRDAIATKATHLQGIDVALIIHSELGIGGRFALSTGSGFPESCCRKLGVVDGRVFAMVVTTLGNEVLFLQFLVGASAWMLGLAVRIGRLYRALLGMGAIEKLHSSNLFCAG